MTRPAASRVTHEGLREQVVEVLAARASRLAELGGLRLEELGVGETLHLLFEAVDLREEAGQGLDLLAFTGAQNTIENTHAGISLPAARSALSARPGRGPGARMTVVTSAASPSDRTVDTVIFDLGGVLMRNGSPRDLSARFPRRAPREDPAGDHG